MSGHFESSPPNHIPSPDEPSVPELEVDQTIAPRPEEEIADVVRAEPDLEDHSEHRVKTTRHRPEIATNPEPGGRRPPGS